MMWNNTIKFSLKTNCRLDMILIFAMLSLSISGKLYIHYHQIRLWVDYQGHINPIGTYQNLYEEFGFKVEFNNALKLRQLSRISVLYNIYIYIAITSFSSTPSSIFATLFSLHLRRHCWERSPLQTFFLSYYH